MCGRQNPFLRVTKSVGYTNESVTRIDLTYAVSAGISWGSIGEGMVPIFEEQITRLENKYTIQEWSETDPMERAIMVATRRIENAMKNLQSEAEIRAVKKQQRRD